MGEHDIDPVVASDCEDRDLEKLAEAARSETTDDKLEDAGIAEIAIPGRRSIDETA